MPVSKKIQILNRQLWKPKGSDHTRMTLQVGPKRVKYMSYAGAVVYEERKTFERWIRDEEATVTWQG